MEPIVGQNVFYCYNQSDGKDYPAVVVEADGTSTIAKLCVFGPSGVDYKTGIEIMSPDPMVLTNRWYTDSMF